MKSRTKRIKWDKQDWSFTDSAVARKLKTSATLARYHRQKLGIPPGTIGNLKRGRPSKLVPKKIDWSRSNAAIARELRVTGELIRRLRIKQGLKPRGKGAGFKYDWSKVDWRLKDRQISEKIGCCLSRIGQVRAKMRDA